jgi:CRISPR-associated protein Cas1
MSEIWLDAGCAESEDDVKRFLNTLFVMTQKSYLKKDGETVVVKVAGEVKLRVPLITLQGIVCFGSVTASPELMGHASETGVSISFLNQFGKFLARVQGPVAGNVLLRKAQYRMSDDPAATASIIRQVLLGKFVNCKTVLQRALRDHGDKINRDSVEKAIPRLDSGIGRIQEETDAEVLRGIEGELARAYFGVFNELITAQKDDFTFEDRSRRPPLDKVNALLSFAYTLLYHDLRSALEATGLDPAVGFLHRDRPGRLSLALDMMEEMRPFFADRLVLSLINLKQIDAKGFTPMDTGAVYMDDDARKVFLTAYQKRKQDAITHPFVGEDMHIGILFHTQAMLMARYIRGELDAYPPFIWR